MIPSQDPPPSRRGRAVAIAILGLTVVCLAIFGLAAFPKNDFKSKFNKIQMDMTEDDVDRLFDGYPVYREELVEVVRKAYGPPDGPCKRTPLFRKTYSEPTAMEARDYVSVVYFDQDYLVVDKLLANTSNERLYLSSKQAEVPRSWFDRCFGDDNFVVLSDNVAD